VIDGITPDFTNKNGQKKVIEVFGTYWHSERVTGVPEQQHERERRERFAKFGYGCLIVWEHELGMKEQVSDRVRSFNSQ